jgi:plasmid stability protein
MPSLSIKDVPEALVEQLRQRAAINHRSLQGELMWILEQALQASTQQPDAAVGVGSAPGVSVMTRIGPGVLGGSRSIEQIAEELRARWPRPLAGAPLASDIIRRERDAR